MKGLILILGCALAVTACGPRDMPPGGSNGNNGSGDQTVQVLEEDGGRVATCPAKFEDSTALTSPEDRDELIYTGVVYAALSAGDRNCFRIGTVVTLSNVSKKNPNPPVRGKLKVTKVEVISVDKLNKTHAKAMGMTLDELNDFANQQIEAAKKVFNPKGMVNLTYFDFIQGSQPNDGTVPVVTNPPSKPPVAPPSPEPQDLLFEALNDRPTTCPEKFADSSNVFSPEDKDKLIFDGTITAQFSVGDRNCFRVGSIVNLQNTSKENPQAPIRGRLKIVKIEIMSLNHMGDAQAKALGFATLDELKTYVLEQTKIETAKKKFDAKNMGSFTYFEYIKESQPAPPGKDEDGFDPGL